MIIETTNRHDSKRSGMWPCVFHANGIAKDQPIFSKMKDIESNISYTEQEPSEHDLTILTWSIPEETVLLQENFKRMGIEDSLVIIPIHKPFNWLSKIKRLYEYMPYVKTKYVMALDATDIIVSTDNRGELWQNLINVFEGMNCNMVWNAEKNSWPSTTSQHKLQESLAKIEQFERKLYKEHLDSDYCHLNSGAFIGKTEYVKGFYQRLWDKTEPYYSRGEDEMLFGGDQGFVRLISMSEFPQCVIDYECRIFQTLARIDEGEVNIYE